MRVLPMEGPCFVQVMEHNLSLLCSAVAASAATDSLHTNKSAGGLQFYLFQIFSVAL